MDVEAMPKMKSAIILAAGKGTRMHSDNPKVMHMVCQKPMIAHIIDHLKEAGAERIVSVVGYGHEIVEAAMKDRCEFALQEPQLGSGHAAMMAKQLEHESGQTLVVNGDCPCIRPETYQKLYEALNTCDMAVLTVTLPEGGSYGRIVRGDQGCIRAIVEAKDCSPAQLGIREINTGIYAFRTELLFENLKALKNENAQHEYYITDLVQIFADKGLNVMTEKKPYYLTTAIAYTSGKPHIGNVYEIVLADSIARWKRLEGYDVRFQTGTDEHGQKVEDRAKAEGVTPKQFVDRVAGVIKGQFDCMNISYDKFIRTTDAYHEKQVQKIFRKLYDQGDIYKGEYEGLYCKECEAFYTPSQLKDGHCPVCGGEVTPMKEEAYFFRMSACARSEPSACTAAAAPRGLKNCTACFRPLFVAVFQ